MKLYDIQVNVYAGNKTDERPRDFTFKEKEYSIKNIIPQTYGENIPGTAFTVETDEGPTFKHVTTRSKIDGLRKTRAPYKLKPVEFS